MNYLEKLLQEQIPSDEEKKKLETIATGIRKKIDALCYNEKIKATSVEVGSVSKNTNLKSSDIDIFITFDKSYPVYYIEKKGLEIGHSVLENGYEKYAEHPYVSGHVDGVKVDIVPAFKISEGEKIVSTVDRTPLHTFYVNSRTNEKMLHDIRLLKVFLKNIKVYGSEITTSGFSGYLCELAVINFGSFENFIDHMSTLNGKLIIPENFESKFNEPVIIIDPVDPSRNAGAAVSEENLSKLKLASKLYMANREDIFQLTPVGKTRRGTIIKVFTVKKPDIIDDIIYPQAVRLKKKIWSIFYKSGFIPVSSEIYMGENIEILIEYELEKLPDIQIHIGPPVESMESLKFIDVWKENKRLMRGPYIIEKRLYVDVRTQCTDLEEIVMENLEKSDIGKNLNEFKHEIKILSGHQIDNLNVTKKFYSKYLF
jgi:tRNA nucleotidyltransferase (CCA-adding enzyme)